MRVGLLAEFRNSASCTFATDTCIDWHRPQCACQVEPGTGVVCHRRGEGHVTQSGIVVESHVLEIVVRLQDYIATRSRRRITTGAIVVAISRISMTVSTEDRYRHRECS